jgi:hypothetical protein
VYDGFSEDTIRRQLCDLVVEPESYGGGLYGEGEGHEVQGLDDMIVLDQRVLDRDGCCWHHDPWMGWVWCCGLTCWLPKPDCDVVNDAAYADRLSTHGFWGQQEDGVREDRDAECLMDGKPPHSPTAEMGKENDENQDFDEKSSEHSNLSGMPELLLGEAEEEGVSSDSDTKTVSVHTDGPNLSSESADGLKVTEEIGALKIELRGRDDWPCDFCGLECFCWTVDIMMAMKTSLR